MSETQTYKEWLVAGDTEGAIVETIEVDHDSWASPVYLTNWDTDITCTIQDDGAATPTLFSTARFFLTPAKTDDGTDQRTNITISNYGGVIYDALKAMSPDDRMSPITIRPRLYLTTDLTKQLKNPSPIWTLHSVTGSFEAVAGDLQISPLRVHRTGRYYTSLEFPVLAVAT